MSSSETVEHPAMARTVRITEADLVIDLMDGRKVSAPIEWFPRLQAGTGSERSDYRLIGNGIGLHWPQLDEDISVQAILEGKRSTESEASFRHWLAGRK